MKRKVIFTRLDGQADIATVTTQKKGQYYESRIKIGRLSRRVNVDKLTKADSLQSALQALDYYRDNIII